MHLTMCEYGIPLHPATTGFTAYTTPHQGCHVFKETVVSCADLGEPGLVAKT